VAIIALTIPVPAVLFIVVWFLLQFTIPAHSGIAVAAHLGGFVAGAWIGGLVRILRLGEKKRRK
jgi:membrane associated rhomboid family serine protease